MMVLVTLMSNTETPEGKKILRKVAAGSVVNMGQRVQNSVFECLVDPLRSLQSLNILLRKRKLTRKNDVSGSTTWEKTGKTG